MNVSRLRFFLLLLASPSNAFCATATGPHVQAVRRAPGPKMGDSPLISGLTEQEMELASWLTSDAMGQSHLLAGWETASPADKKRLLTQVVAMDERYPEDADGNAGLTAYVAHARVLLAEAAADKNPFEGYEVDIPEGEVMEVGSDAFIADEVLGMSAIQDAVFVLVAGGLGERLGFDGIKVELPTETLTCASFLQTYITALLAMQRRGPDPSRPVPLVIMTSEDTHEKTISLLEAHDWFGMSREQVRWVTRPTACLTIRPHAHGLSRPPALTPTCGLRLATGTGSLHLSVECPCHLRQQWQVCTGERRPVRAADQAAWARRRPYAHAHVRPAAQIRRRRAQARRLLPRHKRAGVQGHPRRPWRLASSQPRDELADCAALTRRGARAIGSGLWAARLGLG